MADVPAGFRPPMRQKVRSSDDLYVLMGIDQDFEHALWTLLEAPYLNEERLKDLIQYQRELLTEARDALASREDQLERIEESLAEHDNHGSGVLVEAVDNICSERVP